MHQDQYNQFTLELQAAMNDAMMKNKGIKEALDTIKNRHEVAKLRELLLRVRGRN